MSYDFRRLSDVDVVAEPTETANVLIEEIGVIKKTPKTAIGASGGSEWDAVINHIGNDFSVIENYEYESGSYDSIKAKWDNGELPKILLKCMHNYGDYYYYNRVSSNRVVYNTITNNFTICFLVSDYDNVNDISIGFDINSNGAFELYRELNLR